MLFGNFTLDGDGGNKNNLKVIGNLGGFCLSNLEIKLVRNRVLDSQRERERDDC